MGKCIMVGCDLHDKTLVLRWAVDRGRARQRRFRNSGDGRRQMIGWLRRRAEQDGAPEIVFAYEASGQGFGLYDELTEGGMTCHVLAPTEMPRSAGQRAAKTDGRDADAILALVRGHVLAGNALPAVWVPDGQTRDDREAVRCRLDVAAKIARVKTQIGTLVKRQGRERPAGLGQGWTGAYRAWLDHLASSVLASGARVALGSLLRQLGCLEAERKELDEAVRALSETDRHAATARALEAQSGVGVLTAMVFLTELGDLGRFSNRRQVSAYLGLVPRTSESGQAEDRKGRITRQGPWRVRRQLCQAVHAWLRTNRHERTLYERIVTRNPKHKKKAVVACMRRLGVRLWHRGCEAQGQAAVSTAGAVAEPVVAGTT
jgi:transposase